MFPDDAPVTINELPALALRVPLLVKFPFTVTPLVAERFKILPEIKSKSKTSVF